MSRLLLLLAIFLTGPACAWNMGSHRLIAQIAWQELSPVARTAIADLLHAHPDNLQWTKKTTPKTRDLSAFTEASGWPDRIRQDPRYYDEFHGDPTPPVPGLPETKRYRHWHYTDRQIDGKPREGKGVLDSELPRLIQLLASPATLRTEKIYALPWVIHLVGEAHQPLHVGSRHDKGGILFDIEDLQDPRQTSKNLHQWWDDLPAPPWLRSTALEQSAKRLLAQNPTSFTQGDPEVWLQESYLLARHHAYPPSSTIAPEFRTKAKVIADQRIVEAGIRLGSLLQEIFGRVPRETGSE